jgi:hypothetical protein
VTETLGLHDALGDVQQAAPPSDARTVDFGSLISRFDTPRSERASVRNVVVRGSGRGGRLWKARAAFDTRQRSLVASPDFGAGGGGPDEAELVKRLIERLCAFPGSTREAVSSHDAPSDEAGGVPIEGLGVDPAALETASQLALRAFPAGSTVEWSDDVDENDVSLKLMTVVSPAASAATHEAYVAFVRAWVRAEPPDRRRRIRVSCRAGILG